LGWSAGLQDRRTDLKKLLICSPSLALRGGVETIVNDLCRELPRRGWDPLLALGKGARFNNVDDYRRTYPDLPVTEIDGTAGTRRARIQALRKLIDSEAPDIVLSARIFDAFEAVASMKQQGQGPRLAVAIRTFEPPYLYDARLYRDCIDLCVPDGKLITAALIEWCGFDQNRIADIPGGIHPPNDRVEPRGTNKRLRLGYVGRLEQGQKRIFDFVPLLQSLDEMGLSYSLDIAGSGPDESELSHAMERWVSERKARIHGWLDHHALYDLIYPRIDCFVHFAHTEGVTIAPREAMAHGVVPVISEFTGLRSEGQFVHEWNSLTFPVGDVTAAARQVKRLVSEPSLLQRLSTNAINSQVGKYAFAGSMDAWAEALDRCMERPPARGAPPRLDLPPDGRLARMGLSPGAAQRVRTLLGKRHVHDDPGSEWPTGSGLLAEEAAEEIMRFSRDFEARSNPTRQRLDVERHETVEAPTATRL